MSMTREEHLAWAKERALAEMEYGGPEQGLASIFNDMRSHHELRNHAAIELGAMLMFNGHLQTRAQVREFIKGLN